MPFDRGKAEGSVLYAGNLKNASGLKFYKIVCRNRNSATAFACGGIEVVHFRKVSPKYLLKSAVFLGTISCITKMVFHLVLLYSIHTVQGIIRETFYYFLRG